MLSKTEYLIKFESKEINIKQADYIEDVRSTLDKEVDVFDKTHIIPNSIISTEISKGRAVIYEE